MRAFLVTKRLEWVKKDAYLIESFLVVSLIIFDDESVDMVDILVESDELFIIDVVSVTVVDDSVFVLEQAVAKAITVSRKNADFAMFVSELE